MKNKGFASMTIVYSFLLVFLLTLVSLLALYTEKSRYVDSIVEEGKEDLGSVTSKTAYQKLVFSGGNQSFLIDAKGALLASGNNQYGQLGIGNTTAKIIVPINVTNWLGTKFVKVSSGPNHTLAIDEAKNLWSWGYNSTGQLGNNSTTQSTIPVKITNSELTGFVAVSAGGSHSLAIDINGALWAWGYNYYYQLGDGTSTTSQIPKKITNTSGTKFVSVSAGDSHSLAIDENGDLWVWGYNNYYQLGDGTTGIKTIPTKVINTSGTKFVSVSAGDSYSLAIDENGDLWTWGYNGSGQLGNGSYSTLTKPTKITNTDGTKFVLIDAGGSFSGGIDTAGNLWMWGANSSGQLGNNSTTQSNIPIKITNPYGAKFVSVSLGTIYTQAVDANGNVLRWGYNNYGQFGNNTYSNSNVPIKTTVYKPDKLATLICGSMSLDKLGNLWTWGYNSYGQLGNNSTSTLYIPTKITNSDGTKFINIYTSNVSYHTVALDEVGNLWAWGNNSVGQLGNNTQTNSYIPIKITNTDGTKFVTAATGGNHTLAIDTAGNLWTWGYNSVGQLGNNSTANSKIPIKITNSDGTKFVSVSAGNNHSMAIDVNGALWTWGYNNNGQLGNNTQTNSSVPIKITNTSGTKFSLIDGGDTHSIAIDENGDLWTWGYNSVGQLGNNSTTLSKIPIKITNSDGTKFISISAGNNHNLAIDVNHNLWAWGYNYYYQLGDGTNTTSQIPKKITNTLGTKFISASAADSHSIAIDEAGNLWSWGNNNYYQLGNNSSATSTVPIRIALIQ